MAKQNKSTARKQTVVKSARKAKRNKKPRQMISHKDYFLKAMALPEHVGPFRVPRQGSSVRTVLGMDHTFMLLNNASAGAVVNGLQMGTNFDLAVSGVASSITSTSSSGSLSIANIAINDGVQFPAAASVHDANLVSGSLSVSYLGKPLDCTGEVLLGCAPQLLTGATSFNSLRLYPGTTWITMVDLMNKGPFTVPLRHLSPKSFEFKTPANAVEDLDTPFVLVRGLAADSSIQIEWVRNWECRSNPNSIGPNSIPYESASESFTKDLGAFQDACADFSNIIEPARQHVTSQITSWMSGMFPSASAATIAAITGSGAAYAASGSRIFQQIRGSGGSRPLLPLYR